MAKKNEFCFKEDKEEEVIGILKGSYEDVEITFDAEHELFDDLTFEDCNIIFDLSKGARIKDTNSGEYKIKFIDCEILFIGGAKKPAINLKKANISFENCTITQNNSTKELNSYVYAEGKGRVEVLDCEISYLYGRFIQSKGYSVYVENCTIDANDGEFCEVVCNKDIQPSINFSKNTFIDCKFSSKKEYKESGKLKTDTVWDRIAPSVLDFSDCINVSINDNTFKNVDIGCIRSQVSWQERPCVIKGCLFDRCLKDNLDSLHPEDSNFNIFITGAAEIIDCTFEKSRGIYTHAQYTKLLIKGCKFKSCQIREKFHDGIIYIMNEVDEQIINIEECSFNNCIVEGKYSDDNRTGIIYIIAGVPKRKQEGSVLVKNCTFTKCKSEANVYGKEKQDGFFGKTITFYREV